MTRTPTVNMISTDWGEFPAPADLPPMFPVAMRARCPCGCGRLSSYVVLEPAAEYAEAFQGYVKAQGERIRDGLDTQTFNGWRASLS